MPRKSVALLPLAATVAGAVVPPEARKLMWAGNEVSGSMMQVDKKKATQKSCTEEDLKKVVGRGCWCERSPDSGSGCADGGYEWMSKEQAQGDGNCLSLRERAQYGYCDHTGPYCTEKCEAR